jgi:hypothetical protein
MTVRLDQGILSADLTPNEIVNSDSALCCPSRFQGIKKKYWRFPTNMRGLFQNANGWATTLDWNDAQQLGSFEFSAYEPFSGASGVEPFSVWECKFVLYTEFWTETGGVNPI